ncbi:hypothetical protein VOLCADRAFT_87070 [Volvox carteri f. nagariensis]|uniref:Pheophorbide a oxygenase domain-containing protein n=1 Tax=Volvox carteri f. nagariensis TaxID=3068 RepID=D8TK33_VOLCA|nr:uncharacterized protein VOLCADRAFT_87070 [Volvox carteri f. nagariensis]EFJ52178.1 hypothetical protein VOLCADRAFT_87070 [Volvox carteri f. nagariensis]|eukprot:XP_002946952.1 hypothetical protein VOLCADRAFT_87070 [Volvox carteri f. nagariensis]
MYVPGCGPRPYARVRYHLAGGRTTLFFWTMAIPVRPGVARVYFKFGFASAAAPAAAVQLQQQQRAAAELTESIPERRIRDASGAGGGGGSRMSASRWLKRLAGSVPHWLLAGQLIADQDLVVINRQEMLMRREGLTARDYNLNSKADAGVAAFNVWLKKAGYPDSLWGKGPAPQSGHTFSTWPATELSLEQLLSRQDRHVRHCAVCQRGMKLVTAVCTALTAAAGVAAVAATTLAVLAAISPDGVAVVGGWGSLTGAVALVVVLAALAVQGWSFREESVVSALSCKRAVTYEPVDYKLMERFQVNVAVAVRAKLTF